MLITLVGVVQFLADFVIYLYDGNQQSAISAINGYFSYSIDEQGPFVKK